VKRTYTDRLRIKEFRMSVVNRVKDLEPRERAVEIDRIVAERHVIPFSGKTTLGRSSVYRWVAEYHAGSDKGTVLMGKTRTDSGETRNLTEEQKDALVRWRYDNPYRTIADLGAELAEHDSTRTDPMPSASTIARFLRSGGLSRDDLLRGSGTVGGKVRLAFEAEYPQQLWMADTKGPDIRVEDPRNPGCTVKAVPVVLIDDCSRYLPAAAYTTEENEYVVMELFKSAVGLYGVPEKLYVDRGGPYSGKALDRAASMIGCNLLRTKPRDCSAKGKIERLLKTVHERLEAEMTASGRSVLGLAECNEYLHAYINQEYHRSVHSSTGRTPEEHFHAFPPELRRWVGRDSLAMIFLPCRTASVSKTGLIQADKIQYLVGDATLYGKKVEIRKGYADKSKVYVWYLDRYYGEAFAYTAENDFMKRREIGEAMAAAPQIELPPVENVPLYGRLDRLLQRHRDELEGLGINEQIVSAKQRKGEIRAALTKKGFAGAGETPAPEGRFDASVFIHLMAKLLRRNFDSGDRLAAHVLWNSAGPLDERTVRETVGRLLGEGHPTEDLKGYLEQIRLAVVTGEPGRETGKK